MARLPVPVSKKLFLLRFHRGIFRNERRPRAFEAFLLQFVRRAYPEFAAADVHTRVRMAEARGAGGNGWAATVLRLGFFGGR
jgi:hypothetical protein